MVGPIATKARRKGLVFTKINKFSENSVGNVSEILVVIRLA